MKLLLSLVLAVAASSLVVGCDDTARPSAFDQVAQAHLQHQAWVARHVAECQSEGTSRATCETLWDH